MKKLVLLAIISMSSSYVFGQKTATDRLANLNLTEQQKASVDSVRKIYDAQRKTIKSDADLATEEKTGKMKFIRKEQNKAIHTILTDEQKKNLKKEDEERKEKSRAGKQ